MKRLFWCIVSLLACQTAQAQNFHVRVGATGTNNGSDWCNAFTVLPSTLVRGATYFVADGNYPAYTFRTAVSGTTMIAIKKALPAAHGSDTCWNDTFGDGLVQFGPLFFTTGFAEFDGVVGTRKAGHGFKILGTAGGQKLVHIASNVSTVAIRHTEINHRGLDFGTADDGLYVPSGPATNITFSHCYFHDFSRAPILTRRVNGIMFEHSWVARNSSSAAQHSEAWSDQESDNVTIRFSFWEDIEGTGYIVGGGTVDPSDNWQIYGNVFFYSPTNPTNRSGMGNGVIATFTSDTATNWKIYNNTIVNIKTPFGPKIFISVFSSSIELKNNLWVDNLSANHSGQMQFDSNSYFDTPRTVQEPNIQSAAGDPLRDWRNEDFRLAVDTAPGVPLPAPFNVDPTGRVRGIDGRWDRGAFERTRPQPPTNLRIN